MSDRKTWFEAELDVDLAGTFSVLARAYRNRGKAARAAFLARLEAAVPGPPKLPVTEYSGISLRSDKMPEDFPVTGRDGHGEPTPTVRELAAILLALPEEMQGWPVTRYCEEGVAGLRDETGYEHESGREERTPHIAMW